LITTIILFSGYIQSAEQRIIFETASDAGGSNSELMRPGPVETYTSYTIKTSLLSLFEELPSRPDTIDLQFSPYLHFQVKLERYSLLTDHFRLRIGTDQGTRDETQPLAATFKGSIIDDPGSEVRLTVSENYFSGFIKTGGDYQYFVEMESSSSPVPESILGIRVYRPVPGIAVSRTWVEDFSPVPEWYPKAKSLLRFPQYRDPLDTTIYEAEIALIVDYAAFAKVDSIALLANELLNILNYTDAYYNQVNIAYRLVEIFIFTSSDAESWPDTQDAGELLSAVDQWIAEGGMSNWHDLATFWTGREIGYSYAWLNTIGEYGRHHLVEFWGAGNTRWLANFQTHEAGHNWGAKHVEQDRRWIMSPSIYNGVLNWHSTTVSAFPGYISRAMEHLNPVDSTTAITFLFHQPVVIDDDNFNGIPDPGESLILQLHVENIGTATSANTVVYLSLSGPAGEWVTLDSERDTIGVIESFAHVNANHRLTIDQNIPIPAILDLNYLISDGNTSGNAAYVLRIGRIPVYRYCVAGIQDDGNSNGRFDPGESVVLLVDIENQGKVSGHNIELSVRPAVDHSPYIHDMDSLRIIDHLAVTDSVQLEIPFRISSDFPVGTELGLVIALKDSFTVQERMRSFVVGTPDKHLCWEDFEYFGLGLSESNWLQEWDGTTLPIRVLDTMKVHDEVNGDWDSRPYAGHRSLFSGENWLSTGPGEMRIITPPIDLRSASVPRLNFKEIRGWDNFWPQRKTEHEIWIEGSTESTGPWTTLANVRTDESNFQTWQSVENIDLSPFAGGLIYISFYTNTHHYYWRIDNIAIIESDLAHVEEHSGPMMFALAQNYPNPFNTTTNISYSLPTTSEATLIVYDVIGQEVITLVNSTQPAGIYKIQWHGTDHFGAPVSTGLYLCRLRAGNNTKTIKIVYLK